MEWKTELIASVSIMGFILTNTVQSEIANKAALEMQVLP